MRIQKYPGVILAGFAAFALTAAGPPNETAKVPPYSSTYRPAPQTKTLIINATILDGAGKRMDRADVLIDNGRIVALGPDLARPESVTMIDAVGRWITPGLIDVHTHAGTFTLPQSAAERNASDVSELADPNQADIWIEHGVRTSDPVFSRALAGGVTAMQILPGSSNLFGGRAVVVKPIAASTMAGMKFPDAPQGMKMACGSNPTNSFGSRGRGPNSRSGALAMMRRALIDASHHRRGPHEGKGRKKGPPRPRPDEMKIDALARVLDGDLPVHIHCYRADDMATMIGLAEEFGFRITAFHHATEAYKIAPLLVRHGACVAVWPDWWGFKREAEDAIPENAAFVDAAGGCVMMHSDIPVLGDKLNVEAAKAMAAGRRAGVDIPSERAIRWITTNPARALGLGDRIGTIAPGFNADIVLWSGDPFSVRNRADMVFIDGAVVFDRKTGAAEKTGDFELGRPEREPVP